MINSIKLTNFKAFNDIENNGMLEITLDSKNLLVYGDNGSGKSSIYEALKLSFYKRRLLENIIAPAGEMQSEIVTVLSREYDNRDNSGFEVDVNGITTKADSEISDFPFQLSLLNLYSSLLTDEMEGESKKDTYRFLNLKNLLNREFLSINLHYEEQNFTELITNVNAKLSEFKENIQIGLDSDFNVKIDDEQYLNLYFNEAKINLVVLLLLLESIYLYSGESQDNVIVLDDIITSLDMANRTFLLKYILERFTQDSFQLIILTHNLEVYKLVEYINDKILKNQEFKLGQLFEIDNKIKFFAPKITLNLDTIGKKIKSNPVEAGNLIRKKFELLIHELARSLIIGSNDQANMIVDFLSENNRIYLKKEGKKYKTANNLILDIEKKIDNSDTIESIKFLIDDYKISSTKMDEISDIIKDIKLYRKVIMNPLSHTEAPFAIKELYASLDLLKKLDEMEFEGES